MYYSVILIMVQIYDSVYLEGVFFQGSSQDGGPMLTPTPTPTVTPEDTIIAPSAAYTNWLGGRKLSYAGFNDRPYFESGYEKIIWDGNRWILYGLYTGIAYTSNENVAVPWEVETWYDSSGQEANEIYVIRFTSDPNIVTPTPTPTETPLILTAASDLYPVYRLTGSVYSDLNGIYKREGELNGKSFFSNNSIDIYWEPAHGGRWRIGNYYFKGGSINTPSLDSELPPTSGYVPFEGVQESPNLILNGPLNDFFVTNSDIEGVNGFYQVTGIGENGTYILSNGQVEIFWTVPGNFFPNSRWQIGEYYAIGALGSYPPTSPTIDGRHYFSFLGEFEKRPIVILIQRESNTNTTPTPTPSSTPTNTPENTPSPTPTPTVTIKEGEVLISNFENFIQSEESETSNIFINNIDISVTKISQSTSGDLKFAQFSGYSNVNHNKYGGILTQNTNENEWFIFMNQSTTATGRVEFLTFYNSGINNETQIQGSKFNRPQIGDGVNFYCGPEIIN
jgi:hypothetical protein